MAAVSEEINKADASGQNPEKDTEEKKSNDDDAKDKPSGTDFSGSWTLKSNSKNIDDYYKSEGWGYLMRKAAPMIAMKQIIHQNGETMKVQVKVVVMGKEVANETTSTVLGGSDEYEFKDKDGLQRGLSKWNEDRAKIISETYRVDDSKRTYKSVRYMVGDQMMLDTTNCHGITLTQTFEVE